MCNTLGPCFFDIDSPPENRQGFPMQQSFIVFSACASRALAGLLFFLFSAFISNAPTLSTMAAELSVREYDIAIRNAKIPFFYFLLIFIAAIFSTILIIYLL